MYDVRHGMYDVRHCEARSNLCYKVEVACKLYIC